MIAGGNRHYGVYFVCNENPLAMGLEGQPYQPHLIEKLSFKRVNRLSFHYSLEYQMKISTSLIHQKKKNFSVKLAEKRSLYCWW